MGIAGEIAQRSKDESTQCGAVIVDNEHRVISVGFNGPPRAIPDGRCPWTRPEKYPFVVHAEDNAIWFGAQARGVDGLKGATLYVTHRPCSRCVLNAVRARISTIVYGSPIPAVCDDADWAIAQEIATLGSLSLEELR